MYFRLHCQGSDASLPLKTVAPHQKNLIRKLISPKAPCSSDTTLHFSVTQNSSLLGFKELNNSELTRVFIIMNLMEFFANAKFRMVWLHLTSILNNT